MYSTMLARTRCISQSTQRLACRHLLQHRKISTLQSNPHIYVHTQQPELHVLSYLSTSPPNPSLSIGTVHSATPEPTSSTLIPNPNFLPILHSVLKRHAFSDPDLIAAANAYASSAMASTGVLSPGNVTSQRRRTTTSRQQQQSQQSQRGGWIHVSDTRCPPDWARIAWPEDIFGSLEVDGQGRFVDASSSTDDGGDSPGRYQESGTYRIVTREGILGLSPFLRHKLVEHLLRVEAGVDT